MSFSATFHYNIDEMPSELKSCSYHLAYGKIGFLYVVLLKVAEFIDKHEVRTSENLSSGGSGLDLGWGVMGWGGLAKGLEEQKRIWVRKVSSVLLGKEKPL